MCSNLWDIFLQRAERREGGGKKKRKMKTLWEEREERRLKLRERRKCEKWGLIERGRIKNTDRRNWKMFR